MGVALVPLGLERPPAPRRALHCRRLRGADVEGRDVVRDAIAEAMDCVVGWTSGRASLQSS